MRRHLSSFPALLLSMSPTGRKALCEDDVRKTRIARVSYTSTMRGDISEAAKNIDSVVRESVWRNTNNKVSGHMCYDMGEKKVWQVLEGSPEAVKKLWERIYKDRRHVIDEDAICHEESDSRKYPESWGMKYSAFNESIASHTGMEQQLLEELTPKLAVKNARLGLSGWMLYNDRTLTVYQILEGPPDVVEKVWETIRQDTRHEICADTVRRKMSDRREFPNWPMSMDKVEQSQWSKAASY
eukprot:TRINITY_DN7966_c0_g1_i2.p1 TRINITY_DN7966_c0_g1~~TRINITY_DN7966_c0_g1_i2.p1  ORF type:complete len:241 (+),score=46.25 TRINITY_DN7966_c0_g1_i2:34-756(+)